MKRFIIVLMVSVMLLCFSGCGKNNQKNTNTETTKTTISETEDTSKKDTTESNPIYHEKEDGDIPEIDNKGGDIEIIPIGDDED